MKDSSSVRLLTCAATSVKLWSPPNYELAREIVPPHSASQISSISYDHINNRIISCNNVGQGIVVTSLDQDESELLTPEINAVKIDLSFNCKYLLGGTLLGKMTLLDLKSKKVKQTYNEHSAAVSVVKISSRSHSIAASGDKNGGLVSYNIASGKSQSLSSAGRENHKNHAITALNFSPFRNGILCSGSENGQVVFWDTAMCCETVCFDDVHVSQVTSLSFSPVNEMLLLTSSMDRRLAYMDTTSHSIVKVVETENNITNTCLLSDGTTSAVATEDGLVFLYDLRKLDAPKYFFTSHFGTAVSHLSQLTAPASYSSKRSASGSLTSLNEVNGKASSGLSSSGFTSTSETESDLGNTNNEMNNNRGPVPVRAGHHVQSSSQSVAALSTPTIKRPLSSSNIGPNLVLPSYYGGSSVFSPIDSAHASSTQDLYSKSKLNTGSPISLGARSPLVSEIPLRLPRASSTDDSFTTVSDNQTTRNMSLDRKPPLNEMNLSATASVETQTDLSSHVNCHLSSSNHCQCTSSSSVSAPETIDLLRKTILESTESVKYLLQKEFSNAQINSYNDFFTLKKMVERLNNENEAMKQEIAELRDAVGKITYKANFFS